MNSTGTEGFSDYTCEEQDMKRPRDEDPVELFSDSKNTSSQELCLPIKTKKKERHEIQKAQK